MRDLGLKMKYTTPNNNVDKNINDDYNHKSHRYDNLHVIIKYTHDGYQHATFTSYVDIKTAYSFANSSSGSSNRLCFQSNFKLNLLRAA